MPGRGSRELLLKRYNRPLAWRFFFFFFRGRSQLQHEVIQTRLQKETAGQRTENKVQRTKDKETGELKGNKET